MVANCFTGNQPHLVAVNTHVTIGKVGHSRTSYFYRLWFNNKQKLVVILKRISFDDKGNTSLMSTLGMAILFSANIVDSKDPRLTWRQSVSATDI